MNVIAKAETAKQKATFRLHYDYICKQNNMNPLQNVTAALRQNKLDIIGDRIKLDDWGQIVKALRYDKSLHMIAIRSRYPSSTILDVVDEKRAKGVKKQPVLFTRYVMGGLVSAINECLASTEACTYLELEGLPLRREFLDHLLDGVGKCASLQKLSLYRSNIGDQGVAVICQALKDMPNIKELDLTGCGVTKVGAGMVASLLKYQSLQRWGEGWKQSLRYRVPDMDTFPGIRRITLNHNMQLGDHGLKPIMDTLKDDIFLRALDLQGCGLSSDAAIQIINTLRVNKELVVVDVRANEHVSRSLLTRIMQLLANNQGCSLCNGYNWLDLGTGLNPRKAPTSKTSLALRPETAPVVRSTPKRRAIAGTTAASAAPDAKTLAKFSRPTTCLGGKVIARAPRQSPRSPKRSPRSPRRSPRGKKQSPRGKKLSPRGKKQSPRGREVVETRSETQDVYEEVFTTPPVFFEADRLREDCQLLSMELRDEVDKRQQAEVTHENVRAEMSAMRAQLEQERAKRLEAESVMHNLLRAVKKANDVNAGLKLQRDAAIIAAMEPGRHKLFEEFVPDGVSNGRSPGSRGGRPPRPSPNKLKKWSRRVEKTLDPAELRYAEQQAGDTAKTKGGEAPSKLPRSQQVFLQLDKQSAANGNDLWNGE